MRHILDVEAHQQNINSILTILELRELFCAFLHQITCKCILIHLISSNIDQAFVNFSCMFLKPNYFFQFEFQRNYDLSLFFYGSQNFCQLLACSLEFQTFFSISRTFFSSQKVKIQNTNHSRERVSSGAEGAQTCRSLGYHLLHPLILRPKALFYRTDCTGRSKFLTHALKGSWVMLA